MNGELILVLDQNGSIDLTLDNENDFELVIGEGTSAAAYPGPYHVRPALYVQQTLETNGLLMTDNVTVSEIPVTYTSNPFDGKTVVIG